MGVGWPELIDGVVIAGRIRGEVAGQVAALKRRGVTPGLTVVLVGNDEASAVYVGSKERTCKELGMAGETFRLPAETTQEELLAIVDRLNADVAVHGILVQMPLPKQIDTDAIIRRIRPEKDVDGFHPVNVGKLLIGQRDGFVPCTPGGVQYMLQAYNVETRGAECVIVGRSNIVGKPMAALMIQLGGRPGCRQLTVLPQPDARPGFSHPAGRYPDRRGRTRGHGHWRYGQAGGGGDRRGDESDCRCHQEERHQTGGRRRF